ncbi:ATP-binding cassette domain-containing protein [Finegoldia sp. BIOML-A3]|uniref:ABC transporter, ATP-binding protein n=1 Tax=Finegoldia magna ATCC 53516 TaxID=525282 RepID=D6S812_FINMA|nr:MULTISPECIES: ABC transporter ATP-binding protein [Finegoldia]EFH92940.1 ABC transporter, ATP-binding protein [Finegoldia magna ATCC 53516]MDU2500863.1 ABC transporter ATP-binding protein [Finegoldia magna]MDU7330807.1 ABC transporter ATP-binding protein [Finegoldia magna]MSA99471.1 ATP-binding cassette domain-containing protein [Finegoldia sp. BIOML-A3]MSB93474.1 ATP-binding cassette domain-containing protein [Finegoldia sp. BIOML-A4]
MLEVVNIEKSYGKKKILHDISFSIEKGQIKALVGPNGSGKTTLMNTMTNLLKRDGGQVLVDGKEFKDEKIFNHISFFKDEKILDENLYGMDYLNYIKNVYKRTKDDVDRVIKEIGIESFVKSKTGSYSLGMKKKLMLAMDFLPQRDIILLDEPLSGLDPTSVIKMMALIKKKAKDGQGILISSHSLNDIDEITNNILFLKDGKILEEVLENEKFIEIISSDNEKLSSVLKSKGFNMDKNMISLNNSSINDILSVIIENNIEILDIKRRSKTSQERYKEIFGI